MYRPFIATVAALVMAGCAATGVKVSEDQLAALKAGETTEAQIVAKLGQPTARTRLGDGTVMLQYVYAESKVRASTYIPIVGAFTGGADTRSNVVMLRFGIDGKLIDTTSSASTYGTGTGLAAGAVTTAPTQQPRQ